MNKQDRGVPFSVTASGTTTAVATKAAGTNVIYFVTDISATASSAMGTWVLTAGASTGISNAATLWQGTGAVNISFSEPLAGFKGGSVYLTANGTTATYANISGFGITAQ